MAPHTFGPCDPDPDPDPDPCETENVRPAIVAIPDRAPAGFGATLNTTVPPPEPEAPDRTVSHEALLVAVQGHPPSVPTTTLTLPPAELGKKELGPIKYAQAPPAWVMLNVWPAIDMLPVRGAPLLASTRYRILEVPVP